MEDGKLLGEFYLNTDLKHSKTLMLSVESLLKYAKCNIADIDLFAVANGPGSFTGLRIGIAALKGMAMGLNKPCISVSSLHAMACAFSFLNAIICCVMDARCGQVYNAIFESSELGIARKTQDRVISTKNLILELSSYKEKIFLVGDGADLCYNEIKCNLYNIFLVDENLKYQRAYGVAKAAELLFKQGIALNASEIIPLYLRIPQAERELKQRKDKGAENL
jgi:tRNA threonylcarbamoyladenosine biosynthesis protein TsaB